MVQGLGFRPWVYRAAKRLGLVGFVKNTPEGVLIHVQGRRARAMLSSFRYAPAMAHISQLTTRIVAPRNLVDFQILPSRLARRRLKGTIEVPPDLATCVYCRREIANPAARRYGYVFTNCTRCGPRYSIITSLPYDRPRTTMHRFQMCPDCRREYGAPSDRRFHAQPIACPNCGPQLRILTNNTERRVDPLRTAAAAIKHGKVVAIKSIGGFQLLCDAANPKTVGRLRAIKNRPAKPLALMCPDVTTVRSLCKVSRQAAALLRSPSAPIVLLPRLPRPQPGISALVAPGSSTLGVMLPYTPLHLRLFAELRRIGWNGNSIVATSANRRDEPIAATDDEILGLTGIDLVVTHNRPIANRCDDSVVHIPTRKMGPVVIRRSRGYVPLPIRLPRAFHVKQPVLAVGGERNNAFVLAAGGRAYFGPHIGSLEPGPGEEFFLAALEQLQRLTGIEPAVVACDLHPDYWSTRLAEKLAAERSLRLVRVQHHYAHALSVLAEHGAQGRVLALTCDGVGLSPGGTVWGCELLLLDNDLSWRRVGHLREVPLSAGSNEIANPTKVAAEWLASIGLDSTRHRLGLPRPASNSRLVPTSSLGRLFDAAAAIIGACREATFSGQAAMALESLALVATRTAARLPRACRTQLRAPDSGCLIMDPEFLLRRLTAAALRGADPAATARRFHQEVVQLLVSAVGLLAPSFSAKTLVIAGGSFQNRLLCRGILRSSPLHVIGNRQAPTGDGGIALGQAIAAGVTA